MKWLFGGSEAKAEEVKTEEVKVEVKVDQKKDISDVSWGESEGVFPTKNTKNPTEQEKYNPSKWDTDKEKELQKARAGMQYIADNRNKKVWRNSPNLKNKIVKILSEYHKKSTFLEVDKEIKDDLDVKYYFVAPSSNTEHPSLISGKQKIVISYGPFYTNGGDPLKNGCPKGICYINFYKETK